jgi:hypothetical protein
MFVRIGLVSLFASALALTLACSGSDSSSTSTTDSAQGEQQNDACPSSPSTLTGTKGSGEACSSYSDCAPVCCSCSGSVKKYGAARCQNGKCVASACSAVSTSSFCN